VLIISLAGPVPCRCLPLSSNVRRTQYKVCMRCPLEVLSQVKQGRWGRAVWLPLPAFAGGRERRQRQVATGHFRGAS